MDKKCKCPPEGAPEWMLTYGDMMTLLLCFFVLIVSFSQIRKKDFNAAVAAIKTALGESANGGMLPIPNKPSTSLIQILDKLELKQRSHHNHADTKAKGVHGSHTSVKQLRQGMRFAVGGPVTFQPGSADLSSQAKAQLRRVARLIKGYNNIIELRGNAAAGELGAEVQPRYHDLWQLSEARAEAVMKYLTSDGIGLRRDRFRLIANADNEPLVQRAYTAQQAAPNRSVWVVVSEHLVQQLRGPGTSPASNGG